MLNPFHSLTLSNYHQVMHRFLCVLLLTFTTYPSLAQEGLAQEGLAQEELAQERLAQERLTQERQSHESTNPPLKQLSYKVLDRQPHDRSLFTQGFLVDGPWIYESSGRYGQSKLARYKEADSSSFYAMKLPSRVFAEGMTLFDDHFYVLTWQSRKGYVYDRNWILKRTFHYEGEGWGLTHSDSHLIMSDGSNQLRFLNPKSLIVEQTLTVTGDDQNWDNLNELEFHDGLIWANRWQHNHIIAIDAKTGKVKGILDLTDLHQTRPGKRRERVLNGIAWSDARQGFWVTGKLWPTRYLIQIQ
ncbi:glutaminyl-peptide cyclotransferase [Marinibactrum halimedae]|uniref:Glutaminyl-peptide cyclotransferase n=1 Tax=Marinibactrum halimedae TaxID=1444977 RepID=A0AA37T5I2_9GAMM|nr:glutaminyl-peptide cyclotransferase [Marinibactrum halimedae]MCD9458027.1 glutaminyl-peptide cyclotransferase [Marinibactrum halimedae]GLS27653.1 hypothetical protein GCM10007877_33720 [Marinibactrum halimedae]